MHHAPAHKGSVLNISCLAHAGLKNAIVRVAQLQSLMSMLGPSKMVRYSLCSGSLTCWLIQGELSTCSTGAASLRKGTEIGIHSALDGPVEAICPHSGMIQWGWKGTLTCAVMYFSAIGSICDWCYFSCDNAPWRHHNQNGDLMPGWPASNKDRKLVGVQHIPSSPLSAKEGRSSLLGDNSGTGKDGPWYEVFF